MSHTKAVCDCQSSAVNGGSKKATPPPFNFKKLLEERYSRKAVTSINDDLNINCWNTWLFLKNPENEKTIVKILEDLMKISDIEGYLEFGEPDIEDEDLVESNPFSCPLHTGQWEIFDFSSKIYYSGQTALHLLAKHSTPKFINLCLWWGHKEMKPILTSYDDYGRSPLNLIEERGLILNSQHMDNKYSVEEL
jgi:hypothetical protein